MSDFLAAAGVRVLALLRARRAILAVACVGQLAAVVALALGLGPGAADGARQTLAVAALIVPLLLTHGVVSAELRSGVAMLWLQKPVQPVRLYLVRWVEVALLALLVVLVLAGATALLMAALSTPGSARLVLEVTPTLLLLTLCISTLVFAFSGWGAHLDSLLAVGFFFYFAILTLRFRDGWLAQATSWVAFPMDGIRVLGVAVIGDTNGGLATALFEVGRFLALWVAVGSVGVAVKARSPLARDTTR